MNERYAYELTPSAIRDIEGITDYIAVKLCAKESAIRLLDEIESAIDRACEHPLSIPPLADPFLRAKGYRKLIVQNYIVLFIPNEKRRVISVMRVVYYGRDYLKELQC